MKRLLLAILTAAILMLPLPSWAVNTVELGDGFIHVTLDGAADFVWATDTVTTGSNVGSALRTLFPNGLRIIAVGYKPPAAAAGGFARNKTTTGAIFTIKFLNTAAADPLVQYFSGTIWYKPCLVNADQTTPTAAEWWFYYIN